MQEQADGGRERLNDTPLHPGAPQDREIVILLNDLVKKLQQSSSSGAGGAGETAGGGRGGAARTAAPAAALPHLEVLLTSLVEGEVRAAKEVAAAAAAAAADAGGAPVAVSSRVSGVITSESFARLLDMFTGDRKPPLTRTLLTALCSMPGTITDPVVVNT